MEGGDEGLHGVKDRRFGGWGAMHHVGQGNYKQSLTYMSLLAHPHPHPFKTDIAMFWETKMI